MCVGIIDHIDIDIVVNNFIQNIMWLMSKGMSFFITTICSLLGIVNIRRVKEITETARNQ